MLKNYLKTTFRNLKRHKAYSAVNILGLAVGLSAIIFILLYLKLELSYDRFHINVDNVYRVSIKGFREGKLEGDRFVYTPPIGRDMKEEFPEVEEFTRLSTLRNAYLYLEDEAFQVTGLRYASSALFGMFSFRLLEGNPKKALVEPFSLVLSEKTARRIFGQENPLGKIVRIGQDRLYTVTGVAEDPPPNSTIQYNVLLSFSTLFKLPNMYLGWNGGNQYITYVQLREGTSPEAVEKKFPDFLWRHINERIASYGWENQAYLQPMKKIHFFYDYNSKVARVNFYTFSAVALFILLIACINFVNLTTSQAAGRAREVGMRKVVGAHKTNLIRQFLGESVFMTFSAFLMAVGLVYFFTPFYSRLLNKDLNFFRMMGPGLLLGLVGLVFAVGVFSGIYPAFYLASMQPVKTLKGVFESGRGRKKFQNSLVVFQFAVSVSLIICTMLIQSQLRFVKQVDLGYDKENMVVIPLETENLQEKTGIMRSQLLTVPGVIKAAASSQVPYAGFTSNGYIPEGYTHSIMIHALDVDEHFLDTYGIGIVAGRNFSTEHASDREAYLINRTLARQLGWENPIGKTISRNGTWKVIGVVEDFQYATLHNTVEPLLITFNPWQDRFSYMSVKIKSLDISETMDGIKKVFKSFSPILPFEYFFLDDAFDRMYRSEERFQHIFFTFSLLAIIIALLGLFSLSAFSARRKSKEIGIRKVLGATAFSVLKLFSREMLFPVLLGNALAWPAAYLIIRKWLENFAYKESIGFWAFVTALAFSFFVSLITISFQSFKAAFRNPVDELRTE
ncbi:MAG: ABC transporter permease [Candidatus Aminicenantes bacterium]|nr:ABC transporter permease [Candidatus Aminicenantes bacterium]